MASSPGFTRSARERPRPGSPQPSFSRSSSMHSVTDRSKSGTARSRSPRRSMSTSAPTSPVGSPRTSSIIAQSAAAAIKANELGGPVLSSWLDPFGALGGGGGGFGSSGGGGGGGGGSEAAQQHRELVAQHKEIVQKHSEKCKQLREAHEARSELELQIAQLQALGPQGALRQRAQVAEAALRDERAQWLGRWEELRSLAQAGQLDALQRLLDAPPLAQLDSPRAAAQQQQQQQQQPAATAALPPPLSPPGPLRAAAQDPLTPTALRIPAHVAAANANGGSGGANSGGGASGSPASSSAGADSPTPMAVGDTAEEAAETASPPAAAPPAPSAAAVKARQVPALKVNNTDDFLSRLAAAESGERSGPGSRAGSADRER